MLGISLSYLPITLAVAGGVTAGDAGLASGVLNTTQHIGGALGLAAMASIAAARTNGLADSSVGVALTAGYARAFAVCAGLVLVALVVLPRRIHLGNEHALDDGAALGEALAYEPEAAALLTIDGTGLTVSDQGGQS